jgi:hypothetical protein
MPRTCMVPQRNSRPPPHRVNLIPFIESYGCFQAIFFPLDKLPSLNINGGYILEKLTQLDMQNMFANGLLHLVSLVELVLNHLFYLLYVVPFNQVKSPQFLIVQVHLLSF